MFTELKIWSKMPAGHDMIVITLREQLKIEFSTETVAQISVFFCEKKYLEWKPQVNVMASKKMLE